MSHERFDATEWNNRNARRWRAIAFFKAAGHFISVSIFGTVPIILLDAMEVAAPSAFVVGVIWAVGTLMSAGAWWVWSGKTFSSYLDDV